MRGGLRRYDGVTGYTGMPGSGKTYALAEIAYRCEKLGRPVWCNAGFDIKACVEAGRVFSSFEEFLLIPNGCVVVWDELPLYVNARKWADFPDGLLYRLTQIRKDGLHLYYSAIDEAMVDATVRRLTFWYWHCRAVTGRHLRRAKWAPEQRRRPNDKPVRREWVRVESWIAETYDTYGKVAAPVLAAPRKPAAAWLTVEASKGRSLGLTGSGGVPEGVPAAGAGEGHGVDGGPPAVSAGPAS